MWCRVGSALGSLLVLVGLSVCPSASLGAGTSCPKGGEIDYLEPIKALPPIRQVPKNHHIPSSPKHLVASPLPSLLAGGGRAGLILVSEGPNASYRLDWTVKVSVKSISSAGTPQNVVTRRTFRLRTRRSYWSNPASLTVAVPGRPGLYRSDTTITGKGAPATFSQYIRVVPRKMDLALRLGRASYSQGEVLSSRLENRGTISVAYGLGLSLEWWNDGRWVPVEDEPSFFPGSATDLEPGAAGPCERLALPASLQPGQYRVIKSVAAGRKELSVRGYFKVGLE